MDVAAVTADEVAIVALLTAVRHPIATPLDATGTIAAVARTGVAVVARFGRIATAITTDRRLEATVGGASIARPAVAIITLLGAFEPRVSALLSSTARRAAIAARPVPVVALFTRVDPTITTRRNLELALRRAAISPGGVPVVTCLEAIPHSVAAPLPPARRSAPVTAAEVPIITLFTRVDPTVTARGCLDLAPR